MTDRCFPSGAAVKNLSAKARDAGDVGWIPGLGRSPEVGNDNPFQYSCLGNPMDRGAWRAIVHGVAHELDTTEHASGSCKNTGCGCRLVSEQTSLVMLMAT